MAISPTTFDGGVLASFSFLESQFGMSPSHESNDDLDMFSYTGARFAVDVYLEFYGGQLGATIRSSEEPGSGLPVETFLGSFDDSAAPSLPGLMAATDAAAERLLDKLAVAVEYVLHKLDQDRVGVLGRAREFGALHGRELQLSPLRRQAATAWDASDWQGVVSAYEAIQGLRPAVELLPSDLAKVQIARRKSAVPPPFGGATEADLSIVRQVDDVELVPVELTDEQQRFLIWGLQVWHGAARPSLAMRNAFGFASAQEMFDWTFQKVREIGPVLALSRAEWTQLMTLAEVGFASDSTGAGLEWYAVSGIQNTDSIRILRELQRKLRSVTFRYQEGTGLPRTK